MSMPWKARKSRLPAIVAATVSGLLILAACGSGGGHPSASAPQQGDEHAAMPGAHSGAPQAAEPATPDTQSQAAAPAQAAPRTGGSGAPSAAGTPTTPVPRPSPAA